MQYWTEMGEKASWYNCHGNEYNPFKAVINKHLINGQLVLEITIPQTLEVIWHLKINILRCNFAQISVYQDLLTYHNHHRHYQLFFGIYLEKCLLGRIFTFGKSLPYSLIHFRPIFHFYTPKKRQKTKGYLKFFGGIEVDHWAKVG